jgi:lysophospholipase L1-like esterase
MPQPPYHRYVAVGDSSTEGLNDPDGAGGYRGWADRLAGRIAASQGSVLYANLAIRGRRTGRIREEQLGPAMAMRPDLVTLFSGTNDVVARRFDRGWVAAEIELMHRAVIGRGATLLTFTLPDLTPVMPLGRLVAARVAALNDSLRDISARSGALLVDLAEHPVASDPRLWSADRLHANSQGHARMAEAFADALGLPGTDGSWSAPLSPLPRRSAFQGLRAEAHWIGGYLLPWVWQHLGGRSSGDGLAPKRPELRAVEPAATTLPRENVHAHRKAAE